jgi:hypothetical protein
MVLIKITTKHLLQVLHILSWIIFLGVSFEAGGFLCNTLYTYFINNSEATFYWANIDFTPLFRQDKGEFLVITSLMTIAAIFKAILFYIIIKVLLEQKLDLEQPFKPKIGRFIFSMSYVAFAIGLFSNWGANYAEWLKGKGITMPEIQHLRLAGADVWLFMGVVLFVIALIFKRGIEIQTENDLTV